VSLWRAGIERMCGHPPPPGYHPDVWRQLRTDAIRLLDPKQGHAEALLAVGWDTLSLFGLHPTRPARRVSHMGLVAVMHGAELVEITPEAIQLRHRTGSLLRFYRTPAEHRIGALPAWGFHDHHHHHDDDNPNSYQQENDDMPYEIDANVDPAAVAGDSLAFLSWCVQQIMAVQNMAAIPACSFALRSGGSRELADLSLGALFDWVTSRIGWMFTSGIAGEPPQRLWSPSRTKLIPKPDDGRDWKIAFWCQGALFTGGGMSRWIWESSQVASFKAYKELMMMLAIEGPKHLPQLPLIAHTGQTSTKSPIFQIIDYIDRPACLPADADPERFERRERDEYRPDANNGTGSGRQVQQVQRAPDSMWDAPPNDDPWG
jgi:hypothetical protein